jgi:hypothetical protein
MRSIAAIVPARKSPARYAAASASQTSRQRAGAIAAAAARSATISTAWSAHST